MEELLNNSLGCGYPIALANATEKENPVILQQYYDILKSKVPHQKEHCKTLKIFRQKHFVKTSRVVLLVPNVGISCLVRKAS